MICFHPHTYSSRATKISNILLTFFWAQFWNSASWDYQSAGGKHLKTTISLKWFPYSTLHLNTFFLYKAVHRPISVFITIMMLNNTNFRMSRREDAQDIKGENIKVSHLALSRDIWELKCFCLFEFHHKKMATTQILPRRTKNSPKIIEVLLILQ